MRVVAHESVPAETRIVTKAIMSAIILTYLGRFGTYTDPALPARCAQTADDLWEAVGKQDDTR